MNSTQRLDGFNEAFSKNFVTIAICFIINSINGSFIYIYFKCEFFQRDPRYVLYIHLVINDMIMLTVSVMLQLLTYTAHLSFAPCCIMLLISRTTGKNSPMNLAGMAVERYIAVCWPLHHSQICTVKRAYCLVALIWIVSSIAPLTDIIIVLATEPFSVFSSNVVCYPSYVYDTSYHKSLNMVVQVLLLSSVFLTLIITYLKVFLTARAVSGSDQTSARNARNTILLHGVQLLICMLTYISPFINVILLTIWPYDRTKILFATYLFTDILPRLLSPLIYGVRDKKFNSHIRQQFLCFYVKEVIVDFRKHSTELAPLYIIGVCVERVHTFRFLGVLISDDISWTENITAVIKKAQQRLYFLRVLRKHNRASIESLLTYCITVWYKSFNSSGKAVHKV
ncbi:odorant receptor 131-2-like [Anabas testudineus]|uniref:odorant receptor 131-2-like n=1 Tax=Anabas testudineus TaxID=64144 RepID=UPI000E46014C|nr:odorant receptor 131-2-like [Anabas testudineus]